MTVFGMKELGGKVKVMVINRTNKTTLQGNIHNNIQAKSTVVTDNFIDTKDRWYFYSKELAIIELGIGNWWGRL